MFHSPTPTSYASSAPVPPSSPFFTPPVVPPTSTSSSLVSFLHTLKSKYGHFTDKQSGVEINGITSDKLKSKRWKDRKNMKGEGKVYNKIHDMLSDSESDGEEEVDQDDVDPAGE
ncbi:hypothetical protein TrLO_g15500 [Triparma laevis f. longispina]|uniref:Uncharacterized protein n=1 Tax=Triparma laevis f. longispina TaxID=1714387 RepID=A0A9W7DNV6_9STRA|nr:hypothetical protein TrLO_g15500 [Triparma laevis f. longispina]